MNVRLMKRSSKANHVHCANNPAQCGMLVISTQLFMCSEHVDQKHVSQVCTVDGTRSF
jgi:hypothetical protein